MSRAGFELTLTCMPVRATGSRACLPRPYLHDDRARLPTERRHHALCKGLHEHPVPTEQPRRHPGSCGDPEMRPQGTPHAFAGNRTPRGLSKRQPEDDTIESRNPSRAPPRADPGRSNGSNWSSSSRQRAVHNQPI
ncbi:unnamed protein product, partial [Ectocarpus fasciculatus]